MTVGSLGGRGRLFKWMDLRVCSRGIVLGRVDESLVRACSTVTRESRKLRVREKGAGHVPLAIRLPYPHHGSENIKQHSTMLAIHVLQYYRPRLHRYSI